MNENDEKKTDQDSKKITAMNENVQQQEMQNIFDDADFPPELRDTIKNLPPEIQKTIRDWMYL